MSNHVIEMPLKKALELYPFIFNNPHFAFFDFEDPNYVCRLDLINRKVEIGYVGDSWVLDDAA